MPINWRNDLDYWMNQKAKGKREQIWEGTTVRSVCADDSRCRVKIKKKN
jgi:hypothetical protein